MRRVIGRIAALESQTRQRERSADGWRVVLGPFVGDGTDALTADEADDLAARLATFGERPTFAALIAICGSVVEAAG